MTSNTAIDPGALFGEVRANWGWLIVFASGVLTLFLAFTILASGNACTNPAEQAA